MGRDDDDAAGVEDDAADDEEEEPKLKVDSKDRRDLAFVAVSGGCADIMTVACRAMTREDGCDIEGRRG